MQCVDVPARALEAFAREKENIIHHQHLANGRVRVQQAYVGKTKAELHNAMDSNRAEVERLGGAEVFRTKIGRNAFCPCGSQRKFKKCCIGKAQFVG